jgi:hypothetical protein
MKKIVNILFEADLEGQSIVNYDSLDQKQIHIDHNTSLKPENFSNNNLNYAKKNFYIDENGKISWKIKISSDCLKKSMFQKDIIAQSPKVMMNDYVLYSDCFSIPNLLTGWLKLNKNEPLKKSSALTICDAEQTNNAVSYMEWYAKSGEKVTIDKDIDESDNSIFKKENVGQITYTTKGNFDVMKLQFVSADQAFDRYAFNPDKFEMVKLILKRRLPSFDSEMGYYQIKNSSIEIPEYGFLFSNENVVFLIKEGLKRLFVLNVGRRDSYTKTSKLRIKLVENPLVHTHTSQDDWIEINSISDIDNLQFDVENFYEFVDQDEAKKLREEIERKIEESNDKKKEETKEKKRKAQENKKQKELKNLIENGK